MSTRQTELIVYGPYLIPYEDLGRGTSKQITESHASSFWEQEGVTEISQKQGCYVFALKASKGFTPWYVGKATVKFKQEVFTHHKLTRYNQVLFKDNKGLPAFFFLAKPDNQTRIRNQHIDDLETFLIQSAFYKNPDIKNRHKARDPSWRIRGVVRGGKGKTAANANQLKTMLGL